VVPALRLAIGRDGIGLELEGPVMLGCLRVTALATTLPGTRFPLDVSGGVNRFRHRRGELERLAFDIEARAFEGWASPRLRGIVGERSPDVTVSFAEGTVTVCVAQPVEGDVAAGPSPALAFELHALAAGDDLLFIVSAARGADLPRPATAMAGACAGALLGRLATRSGSVFRVGCFASALARALLPEAGARVPATDGVGCTAMVAQQGVVSIVAARDATLALTSAAAVRRLEGATRLRRADEALAAGQDDDARAEALAELERAPRDPEALRRLVEIDERVPARAEAALAALGELDADPAEPVGPAPGDLRSRVGDIAGAMAAYERAAEHESCAPLAARTYERAAALAGHPERAKALLDRAITRAPRSASARWARVAALLALGRPGDALADIESLEAMVRTAPAKYAVWMRAGAAFRRAGLGARAGAIFERALRFAPDEPAALGGLGAALAAEPAGAPGASGAGRDVSGRRAARGVALLSRAADRAYATGAPAAAIELDLARALADVLNDLPAAVAHVARVSASAPEFLVARGLEGRWRARLGDLAGASLAFAALREHAASLPVESGGDAAKAAVESLVEAARFERDTRGDPLAARRHLAVALRIRPEHAEALRIDLALGEAQVRASQAVAVAPELRLERVDDDAQAEASARADDLARQLQADPTNDAVAGELAGLLEDLGRHHELLALLSARLDDAPPERRSALLPPFRATLARLAVASDAAGRAGEAALYRGVMTAATG